MNNVFPSALWHAEHARLIRIQNAVMDSERAARTRELKLESEVARIKEDLAKLKQARATASVPLSKGAVSTSPTRPLHPAGPRGPRPRPNSASSTQSSGSTAAVQRGSVCTQLASIPSVRSTSGDIGARDEGDIAGEEDEATTVLSHHLTQARSARAQERQRRRLEHERMRELNMLLTLGSEVRKWEERLAWSSMAMSRAATSSDDIHLSNDSSTANTDTDPDPRGKRLSRSFSLPSSRASHHHGHHHGHPTTINGSRSGTSTPVSPALPSLSLSPLWRVSAEMILRRRSLSERPRRTTNPHQQQQQMNGAKRMCVSTIEQTCAPSTSSAAQTPVPVSTPAQPHSTTATSALSRPTHVLRGPRERSTQIGVSSAAATASNKLMAATTTKTLTTDSETLTSSRVPGMSTSATTSSLSVSITDGTSSGPISPSSGKRYSVPPPITIPSNAQFCTSTAVSSNAVEGGPKVAIVRAPRPTHPSACVTPARSTTPIKPSALKWAFTADDLAREREMEAAKEAQLAKMLSTSCSESESDDSKSCSDGSSAASSSSSSSSQEEVSETSQQRRGRARFSWRKSLPKDSNNASSTPAVPTVPLSVDA